MSYKIGDKVKVKDIPGEVEILSLFNCKGINYIVFETETGMKSRPERDIIEGKPEIDPLGVYLTVSIEDGVAIAKMFDREGGGVTIYFTWACAHRYTRGSSTGGGIRIQTHTVADRKTKRKGGGRQWRHFSK